MTMSPRLHGFTLIELVVTVAIVGLLAAVAMPMAELVVQRHKEQELRLALREIRGAIDAYKAAGDEGRIKTSVGSSGYPPSLQALVEGTADAKSADGKAKLYFLRRVPRDPFFADPTAAAPETWGQRSYASPPDAPAAGEDVFDVHSRAGGNGLNGIPYRQW